MPLTAHMFLIVCPLALLAGFVDAVAGGGGLISLPAYYLAGLPASTAAGTNKLSATMGTVLAVYQYGKSGKIEKRIGLTSGIAAAAASALGVLAHEAAARPHGARAGDVLHPGGGRRSPSAGAARGSAEHRHISARVPRCCWRWAVGLCVGFYDGLVGPGTGTFLILLFVHIFGLEDVTASGTAKVTNLCSNLAALTSLLLTGDVLWLLGLPAGLCAMVGAQLGSRLTHQKGQPASSAG